MWGKKFILSLVVFFGLTAFCAYGEQPSFEIARLDEEYSKVHVEAARQSDQAGVAVIFEGSSDLHFYAKSEAPDGFKLIKLTVEAESKDFEFGEAVYPRWSVFRDPLGNMVEIYSEEFTVFVPIESVKGSGGEVVVTISGQACTSSVCLLPFETKLGTNVDWAQRQLWKEIYIEKAVDTKAVIVGPSYSVWFALVLAVVAGLSLNIMPCVWPVLPIIVMRIIEQAKQSKGRSIAMGVAFCFGILLFFACLAVANIILQIVYGTALQWGDQFRNPAFVTAMALLLIVMALFMFGVFSIGLPASLAGKSGSGKGFAGAVGMGFLAAVLSTPCSFGILGAAFAWAQGQPLYLGTLAIMAIGAGMAVPYAILTSMPSLLKRLPKAGRWMELFKQTLGFILLIIAVKMVKAIPEVDKVNVLYFSVVLSFCVWMWGGWVNYGTKLSRKVLIRSIAVLLAVFSWQFLFVEELVTWQDYDAELIEQTKRQERPVLIKFTADWCSSCDVADRMVYRNEDIAQLIKEKNVLAIKADTTRDNYPATIVLKDVYHEPAVPVTILFTPGEEEPVRLYGSFFGKELKGLLESLP
ncbi:thioredoxin family protein [Planctomycetota bacterium]